MPAYIGLIRKDPGSDFGVSFPDLPGCVTAGRTLDEARAMAEEALALHLESLAEDGPRAPAPSSLDEVMAERRNTDGVAILVVAAAPGPGSVAISVTIPDDMLAAVDRFAAAHGVTRSGFLQAAAKKALGAA